MRLKVPTSASALAGLGTSPGPEAVWGPQPPVVSSTHERHSPPRRPRGSGAVGGGQGLIYSFAIQEEQAKPQRLCGCQEPASLGSKEGRAGRADCSSSSSRWFGSQ